MEGLVMNERHKNDDESNLRKKQETENISDKTSNKYFLVLFSIYGSAFMH
jgi:hypothetical protein